MADHNRELMPFPLRRRWNAPIRLGVGAYDEYVAAVRQHGEASDDVRMPNEVKDGTRAVMIKVPVERPDDGEWVRTPLDEHPERVQPHEFTNELKHGRAPRGVDVAAYLLAPEGQDPEIARRLMLLETNFRKAGISARHLRFLTDLWASERLPWERTQKGWYGGVTNTTYQGIVDVRDFDRFGGLWVVPHASRRKRSDFEVALATQLAASEAEQKTFGMTDHYGLTEHEQAVGKKKMYRTPDEEVGFAPRAFGPPGLAEPLLVSNSLGNHRFHSYLGDWKRGKMHGRGTYRFADDTEYVGAWHEGKREGFGETVYSNGDKYVGQWRNGLYHGTGTLKYANGECDVVYEGEWVKGLRQGKGKLTWLKSGATFEGSFFAGLRHGHGVQLSPKTGVQFEGEWAKGKIQGNGTLIFKDIPHEGDKEGSHSHHKELRRIRRGLWHKSEFAPAGQISMKDLVHIVDKEDSKQTREKATDYVAIHGTVLAAQLNDWCFSLKKSLRDARQAKADAEDEEKREAIIKQKEQLAELRRAAKEAREKAAADEDFENDSDEDEVGEKDAGED